MNEYINLKTAILLDRKGYNVPCDHYYIKNWTHGGNDVISYAAPTFEELEMWLIDKHSIRIIMQLNRNKRWDICIIAPLNKIEICGLDAFEEAMNVGLQEALSCIPDCNRIKCNVNLRVTLHD